MVAVTKERVEGMDEFIFVGNVSDIPSGEAKVIDINRKSVAVFNVKDKFFAISNLCPHEGGPLAEGHVKGFVVTCPWHDLAFDVRNGQGTDGGGYCVGSYEVRLDGNQVYVGPRRRAV